MVGNEPNLDCFQHTWNDADLCVLWFTRKLAHRQTGTKSGMLTRPQHRQAGRQAGYKAEAVTHKAEARTHEVETHEAEARTHEAKAKFMSRQRFEKPKNLNGALVKTRRHVQNFQKKRLSKL